MNVSYTEIDYKFRYQIGDFTFLSKKLRLAAAQLTLLESINADNNECLPQLPPAGSYSGAMLRGLPARRFPDKLTTTPSHIVYVSAKAPRHFLHIDGSFDDYLAHNMSSKTRSTLKRKVRRYTDKCGGQITYECYKTSAELQRFHELARKIAAQSYQARLFDGALPESDSFLEGMLTDASRDLVRAYILFDADEPVSYLYLSAVGGTLVYKYLGYLPAYANWSVGTVLQWFAIQELFLEGRYQYLDFTEGTGDHKRVFSTGSIEACNVLYLNRTISNYCVAWLHVAVSSFSSTLGTCAEKLGIRPFVRRALRFGILRKTTDLPAKPHPKTSSATHAHDQAVENHKDDDRADLA